MKNNNCITSVCRHCHSYQHEGRRGGMCQQLGVLVQSQWKSCNLAKPFFNSNLENLEEIALLEKSFSLKSAELELSESKVSYVV
jgi:hypothetical protein